MVLEQSAVESFASQQASEAATGLFSPLIEAIKPVMGTFSAIVGGLFGLYLIFIIFRLYYERKKIGLLKDIKYDLDYSNQYHNLPYSSEKKFRKKVITLKEYKEKKQEKEKKKKEKKIKKEKVKKNGRNLLLFLKR